MKTPSFINRLIRLENNRGIAIIYVALILVAMLALVGLAVDIGYMYFVKTQLQNAADSASHAGASKLLATGGIISSLSDARITAAKADAVTYALNNKAAGQDIVILNDGTNVLSNTNDVTVGYWDGTTYTANITPVNALQARPRRTEDSPGGKVATFFGKIIGISNMSVSASAVAALPVRASMYVAFCIDACTGCASSICNYPNGKEYATGPGSPYDGSFAWTTLLNDPTSASKLEPLICTQKPSQNVCNQYIYTTMGTVASDLKDMASSFYDTNYDSANKTFKTLKSGNKVTTGWEVLIPVTKDCPPGEQGKWDPKIVTNYAKVNITAICATGKKGCFGDLPDLTKACKDGELPKQNCCDKNFSNNSIVVNRLECISCSDQSIVSGTRPVIVK